MENYRKVHLREVLINNTSRLRYSAQPEECGLSHSRQTQRLKLGSGCHNHQKQCCVSGALRDQEVPLDWKFLTRQEVKEKASDPPSWQRCQAQPQRANSERSCNLCTPSLCWENCAIFRWRRQEKVQQGITAQMPPWIQRDGPHMCKPQQKAYKNLGKLNIIILLLSGFSPGRVPSWQRDSSSLSFTLFKSFPDQDLGRP